MSDGRLVVFARYPVAGKTKTRLIPALGAQGAAALQDRMTRNVLKEAAEFARRSGARIVVRFTGSDAAAMRGRYGDGFDYVEQGEGDLGQRLIQAAAVDGRVMIVGSDCPGVTCDVLLRAWELLDRHEVVIGPCTDGGYYLIGMRASRRDLFEGIAWSTEQVAGQTIEAARRLGMSVGPLEVLSDVDRPEDLAAYHLDC